MKKPYKPGDWADKSRPVPHAPKKNQDGGVHKKDQAGSGQFLVEGIAALREYVKFKPEAITEISATPSARASVEELLKGSAVDLKVKDLKKPEPAPDNFAPVQARVLLKALDSSALTERIEGRTKDVILALDHINDPRNLGAIARSAAFFGVREVIAPERRQVLLTQSSVATAQGGFALTDLVVVVNLARTLRELKEKGYWIVGADMGGEPYPKVAATKYEKVVLVMGAEEDGLSRLVKELCDRVASIPSPRPAGEVLDSLNVSVATGILLSAFSQV